MFGFRPCAPCCRGVRPDAGGVLVPGCALMLGVLRRWRAARGAASPPLWVVIFCDILVIFCDKFLSLMFG